MIQNIDYHIIPECYIDTNLVETICPPNSRGYNHTKGVGTVAKKMKEKFADDFAVGIIDKDKKEIDYLQEFDCVFECEDMLLFKHRIKHHYIIQIAPAMEKWILKQADNEMINLNDFNIPTDLKGLIKKTKAEITSKYDADFKRLFLHLLSVENKNILLLQQWIEYLKAYNYQAQVSDLLDFT